MLKVRIATCSVLILVAVHTGIARGCVLSTGRFGARCVPMAIGCLSCRWEDSRIVKADRHSPLFFATVMWFHTDSDTHYLDSLVPRLSLANFSSPLFEGPEGLTSIPRRSCAQLLRYKVRPLFHAKG